MSKKNNNDYEKCMVDAQKRVDKKTLKLCPRGYCTAKQMFEVYPSAYANGYAVSVCKGKQSDFKGVTRNDYNNKKKKSKNNLGRWFREEWVNVCEKGKGAGGFKPCGSGKGVRNRKDYPYCRPYYKLPGTTVVSAQELSKQQLNKMCKVKRSKKQGVDGKPTRVILKKNVKAKSMRKKLSFDSAPRIEIPKSVQKDALIGIKLMKAGLKGGTTTGKNRAKQLATHGTIDAKSLADMRAWFARHGPDATNGGTSYPGYRKWVKNGKPMDSTNKSEYRGAVSWLIWGGDPAYRWLKSQKVRKLLDREFPKRKTASLKNNLIN